MSGDIMKKLLLIAAAVASLAVAVPVTTQTASAQVAVGVGPGGVGVRVGEPRRYDRGYRRERYVERRRCTVVRERIEGRHGRVIVQTRRICN
jgi:hypothetical protein